MACAIIRGIRVVVCRLVITKLFWEKIHVHYNKAHLRILWTNKTFWPNLYFLIKITNFNCQKIYWYFALRHPVLHSLVNAHAFFLFLKEQESGQAYRRHDECDGYSRRSGQGHQRRSNGYQLRHFYPSHTNSSSSSRQLPPLPHWNSYI